MGTWLFITISCAYTKFRGADYIVPGLYLASSMYREIYSTYSESEIFIFFKGKFLPFVVVEKTLKLKTEPDFVQESDTSLEFILRDVNILPRL